MPQAASVVIVPASDVTMQKLEWLWPGRIPKGKITVFAGDPGNGKSLTSVDLVARLTTGRHFYDAPNENPPMDALMLFCEDGAADTVKPRLVAARADVKRVGFLTGTRETPENSEPRERAFRLDTDIKMLEAALEKNPEAKLVVIDPITSYLGAKKMQVDQEVRDALQPLAKLGDQTGVSFLLVAHNNKRGDVNALHRLMGAVAFSGVARAVWEFVPDEDEEYGKGGYAMLGVKMNIARKHDGLIFAVAEKPVEMRNGSGKLESVPTAFVEWKGRTKQTADGAIGMAAKRGPRKDEAETFLKSFLTGPKQAREVFAAGAKVGIAEATLKRAKKNLGVESEQVNSHWVWELPKPRPAGAHRGT